MTAGPAGHAEGEGRPLRVMLVAVTVADYANSDPAVVRSGRVKKAVANAVQQEGRLPPSPGPGPRNWALVLGYPRVFLAAPRASS